MTPARDNRSLRWLLSLVRFYDRIGLELCPESKLLPDDTDRSALNERIVSACLLAMMFWSFCGMMLVMGLPLAASLMNLDTLVIPAFFIGFAGLLLPFLLFMPIARRIARSVIRRELREKRVRFCHRCDYDCRGTESPVCPECGRPIAA